MTAAERIAAERIAWISRLPEVGSTLVAPLRRIADEIAAAERTLAGLRRQQAAEAADAERRVRQDWTADEIAAAKAG